MKESKIRPFIAAAGCWALVFIIPGALISTLSLYVVPVTEDLGISRGTFSLMFSMYSLIAMLSSFFAFKIYQVISLRMALLIGGLAGAVGCLIFSVSKGAALFLVGGLFVGLALGLCGLLTVQLVLTNWFVKRTGLIMSISVSFSGIGVLVMSPIIGKMINSIGWSGSFRVSAAVIAAVVLAVTIFMIRDHPSQLGLLPYGASEKDAEGQQKTEDAEEVPGMSKEEALRTPAFWMMIVCLFMIGFNTQVTVTQQSAMIMDKGFLLETAAAIVSVYALFNTFVKIAAGFGIEKLGFPATAMIAAGLQILSYIVMLTGRSHTAMVLFAVLFGSSCCVGVNYCILSVPILFGRKDVKGLSGFGNFAYYGGCLLGPVLCGQLYDRSSAYTGTLLIMLAFAAIYCVLTAVNLRR